MGVAASLRQVVIKGVHKSLPEKEYLGQMRGTGFFLTTTAEWDKGLPHWTVHRADKSLREGLLLLCEPKDFVNGEQTKLLTEPLEGIPYLLELVRRNLAVPECVEKDPNVRLFPRYSRETKAPKFFVIEASHPEGAKSRIT